MADAAADEVAASSRDEEEAEKRGDEARKPLVRVRVRVRVGVGLS